MTEKPFKTDQKKKVGTHGILNAYANKLWEACEMIYPA